MCLVAVGGPIQTSGPPRLTVGLDKCEAQDRASPMLPLYINKAGVPLTASFLPILGMEYNSRSFLKDSQSRFTSLRAGTHPDVDLDLFFDHFYITRLTDVSFSSISSVHINLCTVDFNEATISSLKSLHACLVGSRQTGVWPAC